MHDPFLQLLGMAKRANRVSMGYDMVKESMRKDKAELLLVTSDFSEGNKEKIFRMASARQKTMLTIRYTMKEIEQATGRKSGVIAIEDSGFAARLAELYQPDSGEE